MDDRESLIRLGTYLGVFGDSNSAHSLAGRLEWSDTSRWLLAPAEIFKKILNDHDLEKMVGLIRSTEYDLLPVSESGPAESLAHYVYREIGDRRRGDAGFPEFDVFRPYFYQYLNRIETTLRGALFMTGTKKEIVDLDNPEAFEAIAELRHIQGRRYGETSPSPGNVRQVTAVIRYVHILLDRYEKKCIGKELCGKVRETLDRLSTYPGYFTMLERRRKAEATRPLTQALEKLKACPGNDQDKQDLIVALSIVLFNILPSLQLVKYIATLCPGPANRYLRHEYYAVLALNYLLTGKTELAEAHAKKAYATAPEADMKAYDCLLSGCINVHMRDFEKAIKAFDAGMGLASLKTKSLIKFYVGVVQYEMGEPGLAIDSFRDSRAACADECDAMTLGNNIGTCYMALGNPKAALNAFEEAENAFPYTGRLTARQMRSVTYGNMGIVYLSMREFDLAASYFKKALRASREAGNTRSTADQLMNIGLAAKGKKELAAAANYFTSALNYSCSIDYVEGVLYSRDQLRQVLALDCRHEEIRPIEKDIVRKHPRFSSILMARRW